MENNTTTQVVNAAKSGKSRRGFASMDKERHKLVSSKGGKAIRSNFVNRNLTPSPDSASSSPVN